MIKSLGVALLFFFVQPTFLLGILISWTKGENRIKQERKSLRIAVYKQLIESRELFLGGLLIGLFSSLFSIFAGLPVTFEWIVLYEVVTVLLLVFGYRFIHPMFTFSLAGLLLSFYYHFFPQSMSPFTLFNHTLLNGTFSQQQQVSKSVGILASILLLLTAIKLIRQKETILSPSFFKTKRGKTVVGYPIQPLWMAPVLLVLPGEAFQNLFPWWPVVKIGTGSYAFFLLPVLIGLRYTLKAQMPEEAAEKLGKSLIAVALLSLISLGISFWFPIAALVALLFLLLFGFAALYRHRSREQSWHFLYGPEQAGWKVIAVRPDTPGEKMDLQIGDTILECNHLTKEDVSDFTEALSANRVYCKLRVRRADGEIRLAEAAVFDDAPFDLGIVTLSENQ